MRVRAGIYVCVGGDSDQQRSLGIDYMLNLVCVDTVFVGLETLEVVDCFGLRLLNTAR